MQEHSQTQVAFVTGAGTGFGRLTVETLAKAGYRAFAGIRDIAGRNAAVAAELNAQGIEAVELDVTDEASVNAAAAHVLKAAGHVDLLVNNAGAAYFGYVEAFTPETVQRQYDVNVFGPLRVNRAFLPSMRERGHGAIVYISSIVGRLAAPYIGVYASSKWALEGLAESTAYELRPLGIDVTIVEPGAFSTSIGSKRVEADDTARNAGYAALDKHAQALGAALEASAGNPQDVADAILTIAKTAPGERPLRLVVSSPSPAPAINTSLEPLQRAWLDAFGMTELAPTHLSAAAERNLATT